MVKFYVMRIIEGKTTLDNVPAALREDVAQMLTEQGYENLLN